MRARRAVLSVIGTRPEAIKMDPVLRALSRRGIPQKVLLTGQHADLGSLLQGGPHIELDLDLRDLAVEELTDRIRCELIHNFRSDPPAIVLVQGDTSSALAGALAANQTGILVGHVEAGLRSNDLSQPWPEEGNRVAIDEIAEFLFAPTANAAENLRAESRVRGRIFVTGNTGIDALFLERGEATSPPPLAAERKQILVTFHRRENWGEGGQRICNALKRLVAELPVSVNFLLHPNRHRAAAIQSCLTGLPNLRLLPAVEYYEMVRLMKESWIILTDSGGIQEEGAALGTPVLVLREVTERTESPENLELVGSDPQRIVAAVNELLMSETRYAAMSRPSLAYGDGHAAERIAGILEDWLREELRFAG